jgi:hypothetical protein
MRRTTRGWLALMGGLAMMTALLGATGGAQAATHAARPAANVTSSPCNGGSFSISPNLNISTTLYASGSTLLFSAFNVDSFCGGGNGEIYDVSSGAPGSCLALNSTTGKVYLHSPAACLSGNPPSYVQWIFRYVGNGSLMEFVSAWNLTSSSSFCLYDINGAAEWSACNANSRDDTFFSV